jgi:hypothetical protein
MPDKRGSAGSIRTRPVMRWALSMAVVGLLASACSSDGGTPQPSAGASFDAVPAPSETTTAEVATPVGERGTKRIAEIFRGFLESYNSGTTSVAVQFMDPVAVTSTCGTQSAYIAALDENHNIERLSYFLDRVDNVQADAYGTAFADVTFSSSDMTTGENVDVALTIGLHFSRVSNDWRLADPFPLGTPVFC